MSVDDVVEALGGTTAVAALAGVGISAVSNWKFRGAIPSENFMMVSQELRKRRMSASPAVFGFKFKEGAGE